MAHAAVYATAAAVLVAAALWPSSGAASSLAHPSPSRDRATLAPEYLAAWHAAMVRPEWTARADALASTVLANRARYEAASAASGVPWYVIAAIHCLEGGGSRGDFSRHLHNGDPLTSRTTHVPAGRPTAPPSAGEGRPYTWEESAADALSRWRGASDWSLPTGLWRLEGFNGFGTRSRGVWSPYLWSGTSLYSRGKYVSDGVWSDSAVSAQVGAVALLKRLETRGAISIST